MASLFILTIAVITSCLAYALRARRSRLSWEALRRAAREALEDIGALLLFYLANLAVGIALSLAGRAAGFFVSFYLLADPTVLALSFLQALVFQRLR